MLKRTMIGACLLFGCGSFFPHPCPAIDCANALTVKLTDANGGSVAKFSGTAITGGQSWNVECGQNAGTVDGGVTATCGTSEFTLPFAAQGALTLDLQSPSGVFQGDVMPTWTQQHAGPAECNNTCSAGTATAALH